MQQCYIPIRITWIENKSFEDACKEANLTTNQTYLQRCTVKKLFSI